MPVPSFLAALLRPAAACVALAVGSQAALAVEPFVIADIRIEGLQRGDPGTVFGALPFRIGDTYDDAKGAAAIRALFATGLFNDVRLEVEGRDVVVVVEERPVIASVNFNGMREFEAETIQKGLRDAGIGEGLPFDKALVDRAEQEIKRQYLSRSFYAVQVVTTVTPLERNRVNVTFTITEGDVARIRDIRIVGNQAFSESTLMRLLEQTTPGWLTWYTKSDRYSRAKLNADLETLRAYYTNRGFLDFSIESTQVTVSPDKESVSITISIREGQRYTVTGVRLEGDFLGRVDEFKALVRVRPGEAYRSQDVADTVRLMGERFGLYGFAFARIEPRSDIDRAAAQVEIVFVAQPQRRVYVRRINVAGNFRTRDEVVRRELRQFEAAWYDGARIKLSRDRLDRLGYFTAVEVETEEVPGAPDQVDLTFKVTEKPTGNLSLGLGYSTSEGVSFSAAIRQDNVFGTGNYLGFELNTSQYNRLFSLSSVDPYFTIDGVSRAYDVFYRTSRPVNSNGSYQLITPGALIRFGVPFTELDTVFFGIGIEATQIDGGNNLPNSWYLYREEYGNTSWSLPLTIGWVRDQRNSAVAPTDGTYRRVNVDVAPIGEAQYARLNLQLQRWIPLDPRFTLGLNTEIGYGISLNNRVYPIFKNYYGGGLGSVRGFEQGTLGPVDVTGVYTGGPVRFNANAEFYFPVPGAAPDPTLRFFAFADVGNVWGEDQQITFQSLRASVGLGVSWLSPIGPLRVSYGYPVQYQATDRIMNFQFTIGTAF
jgi:outer membrane protein insertion porin family